MQEQTEGREGRKEGGRERGIDMGRWRSRFAAALGLVPALYLWVTFRLSNTHRALSTSSCPGVTPPTSALSSFLQAQPVSKAIEDRVIN